MKKKTILVLLVIVGLLTITGCGKSSDTSGTNSDSSKLNANGNVNKLYYKYSDDATVQDTSNGKLMKYLDYNLIVTFHEGRKIEEIANEKKMTYDTSKKINKVNWKVYDFSGNVISKIYMYEKDNGVYVVTFAHDTDKDVSLDQDIKEFMNNVSFK